jgi:hypothetical protein
VNLQATSRTSRCLTFNHCLTPPSYLAGAFDDQPFNAGGRQLLEPGGGQIRISRDGGQVSGGLQTAASSPRSERRSRSAMLRVSQRRADLRAQAMPVQGPTCRVNSPRTRSVVPSTMWNEVHPPTATQVRDGFGIDVGELRPHLSGFEADAFTDGRWFEAVIERARTIEVPHVVCHHDVFPHNVLIDDGGRVAALLGVTRRWHRASTTCSPPCAGPRRCASCAPMALRGLT